AQAFAPLAAWSRVHSVPVVLNEFGVLRFKTTPRDRAAWIEAVRRQAERHGFGWAHWEYGNGFGLLDENGRLDRQIVDALLPPRAARH
ncbi:MAG TPA: endoglucanase, partial [Beijerinckiaceae bacterium]|nr:endoglucanase [Beijerinckiaceae bacterium]